MKRVQMVVEVTASLHGQPVLVQALKAFRVKDENNHEHIDRVEDAHETEAHDWDLFEKRPCNTCTDLLCQISDVSSGECNLVPNFQ